MVNPSIDILTIHGLYPLCRRRSDRSAVVAASVAPRRAVRVSPRHSPYGASREDRESRPARAATSLTAARRIEVEGSVAMNHEAIATAT